MQMNFYDLNPYLQANHKLQKIFVVMISAFFLLIFNIFQVNATDLAKEKFSSTKNTRSAEKANYINKRNNKSSMAIFAPIDVKGRVVDDQGLPLPGVSVTVKGGKNATITNVDGEFLLKGVDENATIVISSIGFTTVEIKASANLSIKLVQSLSDLNEVVVIGYGTQSKKTLVGSVTQIDGDKIRSTPAANVQNMLVGKVVGLTTQQRTGQPGQDAAQFFIRGVSTEVGANTPLVLIDDVESDYDQVSKIDPTEIASISFLKDAVSTAVYGIKGANGVMLVTTTRGKIGAPRFTFSTQFGLQQQIKPADRLDSYQNALFWNEAVKNEAKLGNTSYTPFSEASLQKFRDGSDPFGHPNIDWYDVLFKKAAIINTNNLSVSGGNERVKYFTSVGYLFQNGIVKDFEATDYYGGPVDANNNFYYKRYNFRSNLDINATNTLLVKVDLSGNTDQRNQPGIGNVFAQVNSFKQLPPWAYNVINPDGSYGFTDSSNSRSQEGFTSLPNNIVGQIALGGYDRYFSTQLNGNISAVQNLKIITPGLKITGLIGYTSIERSRRLLNRSGGFPSFQYKPETGLYVPKDPNLFRLSPLNLTTDDNLNNNNPIHRLNIRTDLNYERSFGNHNLSFLGLYSVTSLTSVSDNRDRNRVPNRLKGYTYRFSYNYKNKYSFTTAGAYNGTPRFTEPYGFFPSVGFNYNISDEDFWKKLFPAFNLFRLKGSIGLLGIDDIGDRFSYTYTSIYNAGGRTYFGDNAPNTSVGVYEGALGKDDITWQKELKKDISIDFGIFKNKLSGTLAVFDNLRYDILYDRNTIPIFYGIAAAPPQNIGRVQNRGVEIELNYAGKMGKLGYTIGTQYTFAKNKLLEIDEAPPLFPWLQRTGQSIGVGRFLLYDGYYNLEEEAIIKAETIAINSAIAAQQPVPLRTVPIPSGENPIAGMLKFKDLNGDGIINNNDAPYTGKPNLPQSNVNFNLGFTYKNFSLGTIFQSAFDYNLTLYRDSADPLFANLTVNDLDYWTPEKGNSATRIIPLVEYTRSSQSAGNNTSLTSTFYNISAYYVRLRNVNLSYTLQDKLTKKLGLSRATVYVNGSNLFTISNVFDRYNFDPEVASGTQTGVYPIQKIYNFGVNISF